MRDIFVICRSSMEFAEVLPHILQAFPSEDKGRQVHEVIHATDLENVRGARIILYGQYFKRYDWPVIESLIEPMGNIRLIIR